MNYYDHYVPNALVEENEFLSHSRDESELPAYTDSKALLPEPFWSGNEDVLSCYWKAWELAFGNLRLATAENGFPAHFIDTAFNKDLFMYDSSFIVMFGQYGRRAFDFLRTLDNLYAKQHPDGFICRQIRQQDGTDVFHRFDPSSTGPNIMPWAEWENFRITGDRDRLERVFPVLTAFHRWMKAYRTWPDGTYWANGWSGAADNLVRLPGEHCKEIDHFHHGHLVWCDNTMIQVFSANILYDMARVLERESEFPELREEAAYLTGYINSRLWDEKDGFYHDMFPDGTLSGVKNIGAFWALLAGLVPEERIERFVRHLEHPNEFNRLHRVPSLSADDPNYNPAGDYWVGAVWAPTTYMVLRGLSNAGKEALAQEIAVNHLKQVVEVFKETGTIWENYAPEATKPGKPAKPNFVGWGGLTPITILFEYVFGIQPDAQHSRLVWNVRAVEEHGINRYPFGNDGLLDLRCAERSSKQEKPCIEVKTNVALELIVKWDGGEEAFEIQPNG